jgi:hypothetical protein
MSGNFSGKIGGVEVVPSGSLCRNAGTTRTLNDLSVVVASAGGPENSTLIVRRIEFRGQPTHAGSLSSVTKQITTNRNRVSGLVDVCGDVPREPHYNPLC